MGKKDALTYVYCVAGEAPELAIKKGLPHADKPRVLALGDAALIVASVPSSEYSSAQIDARLKDLTWVSECAIGHEKVVEHCAKQSAVVPMKLFTLFSSDERALKDIGKKQKLIEKTLKKIEGREEWGVRVFFDELAAVKKRAKSELSADKPSSGTSFLQRKKGERDVKKTIRTNAAQDASEVYESLALASDDAVRRAPAASVTGPLIVLDAAFLVPKKSVRKFKSAVEKHADRLGELGYEVRLTGPWPAYNFTGGGA